MLEKSKFKNRHTPLLVMAHRLCPKKAIVTGAVEMDKVFKRLCVNNCPIYVGLNKIFRKFSFLAEGFQTKLPMG